MLMKLILVHPVHPTALDYALASLFLILFPKHLVQCLFLKKVLMTYFQIKKLRNEKIPSREENMLSRIALFLLRWKLPRVHFPLKMRTGDCVSQGTGTPGHWNTEVVLLQQSRSTRRPGAQHSELFLEGGLAPQLTHGYGAVHTK